MLYKSNRLNHELFQVLTKWLVNCKFQSPGQKCCEILSAWPPPLSGVLMCVFLHSRVPQGGFEENDELRLRTDCCDPIWTCLNKEADKGNDADPNIFRIQLQMFYPGNWLTKWCLTNAFPGLQSHIQWIYGESLKFLILTGTRSHQEVAGELTNVGKIRQVNPKMPAYVPTLFCSSSYLLSSEQLAGNILPTIGAKHLSREGGTEPLCSSMLIWLNSVIQVRQSGSEACLCYLYAAAVLILLINLQMWHVSPKCSSLN